MRYIRTGKNHWEGIYEVIGEQELYYLVEDEDWKDGSLIPKCNVVKQADNIEELFDEIIAHNHKTPLDVKDVFSITKELNYALDYMEDGYTIYGAIWTDKGLIYVAKMNEKGEFELL